MWCTYCGANTHTEKNCPKTWGGQTNRNTMRCSYCGSREHNIGACPKTFNGSVTRAWYPDDVADDFVKDRR